MGCEGCGRSEIRVVAAKIAQLELGANQHQGRSIDLPSIDEAAKMLNVSEKSVKRAKTVQRDAEPTSVFTYPRGEHSAKPPEIRGVIERMFPDFDESTRLELFARGDKVPGWTVYGLEAQPAMDAAQ
jgi:N6-adenosine-specific RNA methylase IME4